MELRRPNPSVTRPSSPDAAGGGARRGTDDPASASVEADGSASQRDAAEDHGSRWDTVLPAQSSTGVGGSTAVMGLPPAPDESRPPPTRVTLSRILVTGASGFVGSRLATALDGEGHEVRAMTRRPERYEGAGRPIAGDVGEE